MRNTLIKKTLFFIATLFLTSSLSAQKYTRTQNGIDFKSGNTDVKIIFYNPSTVNIVKAPTGVDYEKESLCVIAKPENVKFTVSESNGNIILKSKDLQVSANTQNGQVIFSDLQGNPLLAEKEEGAGFTKINDAGNETFKVKQAFTLEIDEPIYGLGILQNGKMSQRNQKKHLVQGNVEDFVTFFQSVKGYGIFWDNYSPTDFADSAQETSFESAIGDCIDYYFMYGGDADGVIAQMRSLTGEVPMFPLWTYGFWQSRERYKSQWELLDVVKKHRELGVPLDGIIQDWQYWGTNYLWNAMEFLNSEFPNPQQMIDEVHNNNAHIIISIWSSFGPMTKPYRELNEKNLLFNFKTWPESGLETWPPNKDYPSGVRVYDAYSQEGRDIYWKNLKRIYDLKMDGWWMDSTEPDHLDFKPEDFDTQTAMGSFRKVRNAYPLMSVGGVYNNQRNETSDKRVFILTRSGFAGQQRYGSNVWSGDVASTWNDLRNQVPAGLNFTMTGNPNYNSDIGGFFAGRYNNSWNDGSGAKNPLYQELYVRWLQFGAFNPMMRSHGTDVPREIYNFGEKGEPIYDAIEKTINLRYSLLPYIYSTSWDVTNNQSSYMRPLVMDFPKDKNGWDINDEYMFGKALLVAPVLNAQYTDESKTRPEQGIKTDFTQKKSSDVYLPAGTVWYDFYTDKKYDGGQKIDIETTIDMIPLFVKAGSIVPIGPKVQYASEKDWSELQLNVYQGANGTFVLYEDEGDNYNYEKGIYSEIPMKWDDKNRKLTIESRKGEYPGMIKERTFNIKMQDGTTKKVKYNGRKQTIAF